MQTKGSPFQLKTLIWKFRWSVIGTWTLVVVEAGLLLLFPLFMGLAIDDLFDESLRGIFLLGAVSTITIMTGAFRRLFDTRVYSKLIVSISQSFCTQSKSANDDVSVTTARTNMATELVEFMENSFPEIINSLIGLCGTLILIFFLQFESFVACLAATMVISAIYALTSEKTYQLNEGANDEFEKRVAVLASRDSQRISRHFQNVVRWNIRLSDLETMTYSASWLALVGVLLFSVWVTVQSGIESHGSVLAILMYVFGYIESVIVLPVFYQQFVRLQEISRRLEQSPH